MVFNSIKKSFPKKRVFTVFLKTFKLSQDLISSGREFHSCGEATDVLQCGYQTCHIYMAKEHKIKPKQTFNNLMPQYQLSYVLLTVNNIGLLIPFVQ